MPTAGVCRKPLSEDLPSVQRTVLYLGEVNDQQQAAWRKTLDVFVEDEQCFKPMSLFPEDRELPADALDSVQVKVSGLELRRPRIFAVPAPGTWGNAGRNLGRGPSLYQIDMSLARRVALRERAGLEIPADAFNLLNRTQLGDPIGDVTVPSQFGIIQSTINTTPIGSGTPRQIQVMMRLFF